MLTRGYIRRKNPPGVGHFFVIGTTTRSSLLGGELKKNRQLCVRPMWETFRRGIAFAGKVLNESAVYIPSFQDGVSFSSMVYKGIARLPIICVCIIINVANMTEEKAREGQSSNAEQFRSRYSNSYSPCVPPGVDSKYMALPCAFYKTVSDHSE